MEFKRLCIYCGSSAGKSPAYMEAAGVLAALMAQRGIGLVYGGASVGIMGHVADVALQHGGEVIGVIPQALMEKEVGHKGLTKLHVVKDMHERKALMADLSDGFIALPGGLGTLEEIFEVLTWSQLGFHAKPCGLLNVEGYYDGLTGFLDHAVQEQFVRPHHRSLLRTSEDPATLIELMAEPPEEGAPKWIQ